jgi:FkbM family methyltransferase
VWLEFPRNLFVKTAMLLSKMIGSVVRRVRLLLRSELDLAKDRMIAELKSEFAQKGSPEASVQAMDWQMTGDVPTDGVIAQGIPLDPVRHAHFLKCMPWIAELVRDWGAQIRLDASGDALIEIGGMTIAPTAGTDFAVLREIFQNADYSIETDQPMFVWDIGANTGITSLYFACGKGWKGHAYELCPPIAKIAERNIALSGAADKVHVFPCGVAASDAELTIPFSPERMLSNSILSDYPLVSNEGIPTLGVQVRDASAVFKEVESAAQASPILLKMDAEGAEYEILDRLASTGELKRIHIVIMEAHIVNGKEPRDAAQTLMRNGFIVRRNPLRNTQYTMIFAVRSV